MFTASIFFLGHFRPAYFEGETARHAANKAARAIRASAESDWFETRLYAAAGSLNKTCASATYEHGARGICVKRGPHDPFLDHATRGFPAFPGLDYSDALNMRETV